MNENDDDMNERMNDDENCVRRDDEEIEREK